MADDNQTPAVKDPKTPEIKPEVQPEIEMVEKARLDNALKDMHTFKSKVKELESKHEENRLETLKKGEEWQKVAELKEKEANDANSDRDRIQQAYLDDKRWNAIKDEAVSQGLRPEAFKFLQNGDLSDIVLETTSTGNVNVLGSKQYVEKFKTENGFMFQQKTEPNINNSTPRTNFTGPVTVDLIMKAEKEKNAPEYARLIREYQTQKRS